tara:strand:- start:2062 stop:2328 length:267 start_codon:yes stop_codon:yes gene_type:complete
MWAISIVRYPVVNPIAEKKISVATAVTISGTIKGKFINAKLTDLPRNLPERSIAVAAIVAIIVADVAAIIAMDTEFIAAALNLGASTP